MKAAVIYQVGNIKIVDREIPAPAPNEVLIRVKACGVCGTDHSLFVGAYPANYPVIIGHEFSGVVEAVGSAVTTIKVGDRVTADPNRVCHKCDFCRMGSEHLCENARSMGVHIDGADAEYCVMTESNVYKLPDTVSFEQAAFCEPLACANHGIELLDLRLGDTVLVLGGGAMGNLLLQCSKNYGATTIIVSEPIAMRREKALENGATHVIDPTAQDVDREVRKICRIGADVVIEAAGSPKLQEASIHYARRGGSILWFGCAPQDKQASINGFYVNDAELKIIGSYNNLFSTQIAIDLIASGKVQVDNLISHRFALQDYLNVFKVWGSQDTHKLMVNID